MASTRDDDVGRWTVLEKQLRRLQGEVRQTTHEREQEIFQLKRVHEAEEKKTRDHQIALQREMDETHDRLREDKDMMAAEMNRMMELYQTKREHNKKHSDNMEVLRAEKCCLEECVRELENDKMKKEKLHELTASDLKEKLEERESTIADIHSEWIQTKEKLDGAIADTSRLTDENLSRIQQVKQFKKQSDTYRDQLQNTEKRHFHTLMSVESERDLLRERLSQLQDDPGLKLQPYMTLERNSVTFQEEIARGGWGVVSKGKVHGNSVAIKQPHKVILHQSLIDRIAWLVFTIPT